MDLKFYDLLGNFKGYCNRINSALVNLKYNDVGDTEYHIDIGDPIIKVIFENPFLMVEQDGKYWSIIRSIVENDDIAIYGRTLNFLLSKMVLPAFDEISNNVGLISQSLLNYSIGCKIKIGNIAPFDKIVSFEKKDEYTVLLSSLQEVLSLDGGGFSVRYEKSENKFYLDILRGTEKEFIIANEEGYGYDFSKELNALDYSNAAFYNKNIENENTTENVWTEIEAPESTPDIYKWYSVLSSTSELDAKAELSEKKIFDTVNISTEGFVFEKDFSLGDIIKVQFSNNGFIFTQKKRVTGITINDDENGHLENPILEDINNVENK